MFPPTNSWELICLYITLHYPRRLRLTALSKQRETEQPGARSSEERGAARSERRLHRRLDEVKKKTKSEAAQEATHGAQPTRMHR